MYKCIPWEGESPESFTEKDAVGYRDSRRNWSGFTMEEETKTKMSYKLSSTPSGGDGRRRWWDSPEIAREGGVEGTGVVRFTISQQKGFKVSLVKLRTPPFIEEGQRNGDTGKGRDYRRS